MADLEQAGLEFALLAERLKYAANTGLRSGLSKAISDATGPVIKEIRAGLIPKLPDRYADVLNEDLRLSVRRRSLGNDPGVRLTGQERNTKSGVRRRLHRLDRGVLEHPLFGDREHWYKQPVEAGWFTGPCRASAPQMRDAVLGAMRDVGQKITRG